MALWQRREHPSANMPICMPTSDWNKYILFLTWLLQEAEFPSSSMQHLVSLPVQLVSVWSLATPSPQNRSLSSHTAVCITKWSHVLCSRGFRSTVKLFFLQKLRFMCWITSMRLAPLSLVIAIQVGQGHRARRNSQILCFLSRIHCCKLSNFHLFGD